MKAVIDWIKNSWVGRVVWNFWRMFFTDDTGYSMRKFLAFDLVMLGNYLVIKNTDNSNLEWVLIEVFSVALALLGIVTYDSLKQKKMVNEAK